MQQDSCFFVFIFLLRLGLFFLLFLFSSRLNPCIVPNAVKNVPRAVIAYRIKVIDRLCAATVKEVDAAFKRGDGESCKEKMRFLSALNTVKNNLTKELNRL